MGLKPTTQAWQSNLGQSISDLITGFDPSQGDIGDVTRDWSTMFAAPAMQMWEKNVAPFLKEAYNLPGSFYARSTGKGIARAAGDYFAGSIQPTLFNALEAFRNRDVQMQGIFANILGTGAGLSTAQTLQYASKPTWQQNFATLMSGFESSVNAGVGAYNKGASSSISA